MRASGDGVVDDDRDAGLCGGTDREQAFEIDAAEERVAWGLAEDAGDRLALQQGAQIVVLAVLDERHEMHAGAEELLELQDIDIGEVELHRFAAGEKLREHAMHGKVGRHAGGKEKDVLGLLTGQLRDAFADGAVGGFAFFGGVPGRGIYDNMKTAVTSVFTGKERVFNRRFLIMTDHYMVEPTACSPAAGWEKGQVENQVQTIRGRFFQPRLRFASLEELNGWLEAECRRWAERQPHPEQGELTVAQVLEIERSALQPMLGPFDGFNESEHAVTGTCLISFDRNRYSVLSTVARRTVQVRAYADRIVVRCGEEVVAEHPRYFGRNRTIYDPWHYLPVLARKPGALRNGAPFQDWDLPPALARLRRKLGNGDDADRRFVRVLSAVLTDGLEPVEAAVREALATGTASDDLILNILARRREPPRPLTIITSEDSALRHPPIADCARYDQLRTFDAAA